jgi:hypothetical protein
MTPSTLLRLELSENKTASSATDTLEATELGAYDYQATPEISGKIPVNTVENFGIAIVAVTRPDQLIDPSYFPSINRTNNSDVCDRFTRAGRRPDHVQVEQELGSVSLERARDALYELPMWPTSKEARVVADNGAESDRSSSQTPEEAAFQWLASEVLKIARSPAHASEVSKKGSSRFEPVRKPLGRIAISGERNDYDSYVIAPTPSPRLINLVNDLAWCIEKDIRNQKMPFLQNRIDGGLLIRKYQTDRDTYKQFKEDVASEALMLAWQESILEENKAKSVANITELAN